MNEKRHFFLKLNPPRPSFTLDMNEEEKLTMLNHVLYWRPYFDDGTVLVLGPVADPDGGYGIAVLAVEDEGELKQLVANDPANGLCNYDIHPMRAVTKDL